MSVVAGAAGAGKSTAQTALTRLPGVCALDGDTIVTARAQWDYDEYWSFTMRLAHEILANGLRPVICAVGKPDEIVRAASNTALSVRLLGLVCDRSVRTVRIEQRAGHPPVRHPERHDAVDLSLRAARLEHPHEFTLFDTTRVSVEDTQRVVVNWVLSSS